MGTKKLSVALAALTTPTFTGLVTLSTWKVGATTITATGAEINYLVGVTSGIQAQITTKLASTSYTAADVLSKLITVDGTGSALDADLLDGQHGSYYAPLASPTFTGTIKASIPDNNTPGLLLYKAADGSSLIYGGIGVYNADSLNGGVSLYSMIAGTLTRVMTTTKDAYVAIGKTTADHELDVVGTIVATGDIIAYHS
jgi:hypothetical protein